MKQSSIYILHECGAKSHYSALDFLARKKGFLLKYYAFEHILTLSLKSCYKILIHPIQSIFDFFFILSLPFIKPSKIVIGIAPYNKNLSLLMKLMKKHEVYYHTSYDCWDGTRYVHKPKSLKQQEVWKKFTNEYAKHIFAVSEHTKNQLILNGYATEKKISVVNHSYTNKVITDFHKAKNLNFICVGRLICEKGIAELLDIFSKNTNLNITFVGKGALTSTVKDYALKFHNIKYAGYINSFKDLIPIYQEHSFLVLNSKRSKIWEELFGMVIIEGMACGCVPITTDHIGPKEIIIQNIDGIICKEGNIFSGIKAAIEMNDFDYQAMRKNAIEKGQKYYYESMSSRWRKIFE